MPPRRLLRPVLGPAMATGSPSRRRQRTASRTAPSRRLRGWIALASTAPCRHPPATGPRGSGAPGGQRPVTATVVAFAHDSLARTAGWQHPRWGAGSRRLTGDWQCRRWTWGRQQPCAGRSAHSQAAGPSAVAHGPPPRAVGAVGGRRACLCRHNDRVLAPCPGIAGFRRPTRGRQLGRAPRACKRPVATLCSRSDGDRVPWARSAADTAGRVSKISRRRWLTVRPACTSTFSPAAPPSSPRAVPAAFPAPCRPRRPGGSRWREAQPSGAEGAAVGRC